MRAAERGRWLVVAMALLVLPACQVMRTRTFEADRAGAQAAIATALRQETLKSITFDVAAEAAAAPVTAWRQPARAGHLDMRGVVAINRDRDMPVAERWRSFEANAEGLAEAQALARAPGSTWMAHVLLDAEASTAAAPHAWGWKTGWRHETVPFDTGVCFSETCFAYEDIRAVRASVYNEQSAQYPVSRDGFLAALSDPLMSRDNASLIVEVRMPAREAGREAVLYDVSALEDGRICGTASEYPLPAIERCYAYAEVQGGFRVNDRESTSGEALADTVTFPFRLVGAAAASAGIGAH